MSRGSRYREGYERSLRRNWKRYSSMSQHYPSLKLQVSLVGRLQHWHVVEFSARYIFSTLQCSETKTFSMTTNKIGRIIKGSPFGPQHVDILSPDLFVCRLVIPPAIFLPVLDLSSSIKLVKLSVRARTLSHSHSTDSPGLLTYRFSLHRHYSGQIAKKKFSRLVGREYYCRGQTR
jgi:hypothetical protein